MRAILFQISITLRYRVCIQRSKAATVIILMHISFLYSRRCARCDAYPSYSIEVSWEFTRENIMPTARRILVKDNGSCVQCASEHLEPNRNTSKRRLSTAVPDWCMIIRLTLSGCVAAIPSQSYQK